MSIILYRDDNPGSKRETTLYLEKDESVRIEQVDWGALVEQCYGDYDHEWILSDLPVSELREAMNVRNNNELIEKLKAEYNTSDAWHRLSEFCHDHKLTYNIYIG